MSQASYTPKCLITCVGDPPFIAALRIIVVVLLYILLLGIFMTLCACLSSRTFVTSEVHRVYPGRRPSQSEVTEVTSAAAE